MGKKADYGLGHQAFLEYQQFIVTNANYAGMPDLRKDDGTIQWEAPSNRGAGKYQFSNQRRREWWAQQARKNGIDPTTESAWLSRTAKKIHPTKRKPCKKCGLEMDLRYVYPTQTLIRRLLAVPFLNGVDEIYPLEDVFSLVRRLYLKHGDPFLNELPLVLKAKGVVMPPPGTTIDGWLQWLEKDYIPHEPSTLSPGAMSNAPDRLDGFHSFNLCHRKTADTGRHDKNMASYVTDRRVFELWVDGDWIAADRLMGKVRSEAFLQTAGCFYTSAHAAGAPPGNSTADHIGPISLGFCHRDEFQLLCQPCNSGKNNRLTLEDVQRLIAVELPNAPVMSWYGQHIWDLRKHHVVDNATALRLSKILRDNRYTYMMFLGRVLDAGYITFLCSLLHLRFAERDAKDFVNLRADSHLTKHDGVVHAARTTTYVVEQKARRIRVAFSSLRHYASKKARNALFVTTQNIDAEVTAAISALNRQPTAINALDDELKAILGAKRIREGELRSALHRIEHVLNNAPSVFAEAKTRLERAMALVADELNPKWSDARYSRNLELTDL